MVNGIFIFFMVSAPKKVRYAVTQAAVTGKKLRVPTNKGSSLPHRTLVVIISIETIDMNNVKMTVLG